MAPAIYNSVVDDQFASAWLLGQNEGPGSQFERATLAENAWLAIPEGPAKLRVQSGSLTRSGSWVTSDLFPTMGLRSSAVGSALTASISGSAIYVGLSSLTTTDYTVDILIDGVDQGTASPVSTYPGIRYAAAPYGLRFDLGGSAETPHIVQIVCQNPGLIGCYVDWIGSNGAAKRPNMPPYVWTGVTYTTLQSDPLGHFFPVMQQQVRTIEGELESDGLAIRLADIASVFNGPATPECVGDRVHPNGCGNQIEETVWLSAVSFLATEAQRIDIGQMALAVVGIPLALEGKATSALPITYRVVSGSGTIDGDQITVQHVGDLTVVADQSGNSTMLPAASVRFSVAAVLPTTTALIASATSAEYGTSIVLTATVTTAVGSVPIGMVTFFNGNTSLGTVTLNGSGVAALTATTLPLGTVTLVAIYAANGSFSASTSTSIAVTIVPPVPNFIMKASPSALTITGGRTASSVVTINPQNGFNQTLSLNCAGLPAGAFCTLAAPALKSDGTTTIVLSLSTQQVGSALMPVKPTSLPLCAMIPLGAILLLKGRKTFVKTLHLGVGALVLVTACAVFSGCAVGRSLQPITSAVVIAAQTQAGLSLILFT